MTDERLVQSNGEARRTIARLTEEVVPRLIERLTNSELGELEVRDEGWRIRLRRPNGIDLAAANPATAVKAGHATTAPADRTASGPRPHGQRPEPARGGVTSPAVGYFVPQDGVAVGFRVGRGDRLGHVDMLGVRQEVVAPIDGVVGALEVEAGQALEYGQPIARIDVAPPMEA